MYGMIQIESAGKTDVGKKREGNEDSFLVDDQHRLYAVADGMGGHLAGEVASKLVVETIRSSLADSETLDPGSFDETLSKDYMQMPLLREFGYPDFFDDVNAEDDRRRAILREKHPNENVDELIDHTCVYVDMFAKACEPGGPLEGVTEEVMQQAGRGFGDDRIEFFPGLPGFFPARLIL